MLTDTMTFFYKATKKTLGGDKIVIRTKSIS